MDSSVKKKIGNENFRALESYELCGRFVNSSLLNSISVTGNNSYKQQMPGKQHLL
jgi:hypothetical protein